MYRSSKGVALAFLAGALLVGGALGAAADRVVRRDAACGREDSRSDARERFARDLALTPVQRLSVDSILDRRHQQMSAIFDSVRPQLDSARYRARSEIARVLDAQQRQRFQQMIQEQAEEDRRERGNGKNR